MRRHFADSGDYEWAEVEVDKMMDVWANLLSIAETLDDDFQDYGMDRDITDKMSKVKKMTEDMLPLLEEMKDAINERWDY